MRALILSLAVLLTACASVPTPELATAYTLEESGWTIVYVVGSEAGFLAESIRDGDTLEAWDELMSHQIAFTDAPLASYVERFVAFLALADPNAAATTEVAGDGSITVRFESKLADELSLRRFIQGPDGVYMLAVHVRPALAEPERLRMWTAVLASMRLVPSGPFVAAGRESQPERAVTLDQPCRFMGTIHRRSREKLEALRIADRIDLDEWRCAATELAAIDERFTATCREEQIAYEELRAAQRSAYESCWGSDHGREIRDALEIRQ